MKTTATHAAIQTGATEYKVVEIENKSMGMLIGKGTSNECYKIIKEIRGW